MSVTEDQKQAAVKVKLNSAATPIDEETLKQYGGTYTLTFGGAKLDENSESPTHNQYIEDTSTRAKISKEQYVQTSKAAAARSSDKKVTANVEISASTGLISIDGGNAVLQPEITFYVAIDGGANNFEESKTGSVYDPLNIVVAAWLTKN